MPITRRSLLELISSSTIVLTASSATALSLAIPDDQPALEFPQGVASADPKSHSVMLWTRAVPNNTAISGKLLVQVSSDPDFKDGIVEALLDTNVESDHTVRTLITGLSPDHSYYYRFLGPDGSASRLGRTRTAPSPSQEKDTNLAFVSCQSFEQAYYGAWARMLADDKVAAEQEQIQFVVHLGDFIYERSWNKREDGSEQTRRLPDFPDGEISEHNRHAVSLADYRHLYKTYLSDPHLQEARARWPFISTWDDHEFSNDNFQSYTTYGDSITFEPQRKLNANQAWFEYIPAMLDDEPESTAHDFRDATLSGQTDRDNRDALESLCIYRSISWGKYLDIVVTDTRSYRTEPCIPDHFTSDLGLPLNPIELIEIADYGRSYNQDNPPENLPFGDGVTANPWRKREPGSCLGSTQRDWFLDTVEESTATWKLWANSLPLMPMYVDLSSLPMMGYQDSALTIDAWSGYPSEMNHLMKHLHQHDVTGVVSLSGDHHLHGASTVSWSASDTAAPPVILDFACAGISSTPFFESLISAASSRNSIFRDMVSIEEDGEVLPLWHLTMLRGVIAALGYANTGLKALSTWLGPNEANPGLKYMDCTANGYGLAQFRAQEMRVQLITMDDTRKPFTTPPGIRHTASFRVPRWEAGQSPSLEGPEFGNNAPFPFDTKAV